MGTVETNSPTSHNQVGMCGAKTQRTSRKAQTVVGEAEVSLIITSWTHFTQQILHQALNFHFSFLYFCTFVVLLFVLVPWSFLLTVLSNFFMISCYTKTFNHHTPHHTLAPQFGNYCFVPLFQHSNYCSEYNVIITNRTVKLHK